MTDHSLDIRPYGAQEWWTNDRRHRDNGPAIIYENGDSEWWINGRRHRDDGPAVTYSDGSEEWWANGSRYDGPSVIYADGKREWWVNDKRHRVDGPAVIWSDGSEEWRFDDLIHRIDGPAMIWANGSEAWYYMGKLHRDGYKSSGFRQYYKRGVPYTLVSLYSRGRKILRFMRHVLMRSRLRDIRRRRVVADCIFECGVYFPGLAELIDSY